MIAITEVGRGQLFDLPDMVGGDRSHHRPQLCDPVVGECVVDASAFASGADQSRAQQLLQVL
jgi:hypothetical protein